MLRRERKLDTLVGEVLTHIDVDADTNQILLTTASGRSIRIYHKQECCETVRILDTTGTWHSLLGGVVVDALHSEVTVKRLPYQIRSDEHNNDAATLTTLTFHTDRFTVVNRWFGTSNRCYSETITIEEFWKDKQ